MDWVMLISNTGFPIAITLFVLVRMEGTINKNTEALNHIKEVIDKCRK